MKPSPGPIRDWAKTPDGRLVLVDELHSRVLIADEGGELRVVPGEFQYPRSVVVLESAAYVVDSWKHRVQVFQLPEWKFAFEFGSFFCPNSIAVLKDLLVVADTNNRRLSFHKADGSCVCTYSLDRFPTKVRVDERGDLVVGYDNGETEILDY